MKILLADTNEVNKLITQQMLNQKNIDTDCVTNVGDIMERLNQDNYSLILMDLNMLLSNEAYFNQNLTGRSNHIPLVVYTESVSNECTFQSGSLPIDDIIHKPYEVTELYQTIEKHMPSPEFSEGTETWSEFKRSLLKYADHDTTFAFELVDCFIENYQEYKEQTASALSQKDPQLLREAWHKISTSNRIFLISSLDELAAEMNILIESPPSVKDINAITKLTLICNTIISKLTYVKKNIKP